MARSMLGHNLDSIQPDGTLLPANGEQSRPDEPGHVAFALGEFYRATGETTLKNHDLIDLAARCITAQLFTEPAAENGLAYAALGLLAFGPSKERNPVWERLVEETLPADETAAPQDEPSEPVTEVRENREPKTDPDAPKDADRVLPNRATDWDKPGWSNDQREKKSAPERTTNAPCDAKPGHSWPGAQRDDAPPAKPSPGPEGPGFVSRSEQP